MRSTMAGRAPATGAGTLVFTCPRIAREPAVIPSAAVKTLTRRSNIACDISRSPRIAAEKGIRNGDKDEESQCARARADSRSDCSARRGADDRDRRLHAGGQGQSPAVWPDDGGDQPLLRR